jgi:hypothetical protein
LSKYAEGRTPLEIITGETPEISEYVDSEFCDWVLFRSNAGLGEVELAKWLGVSCRVGQLMSHFILSISGIPVAATTVQLMTHKKRATKEMKAWIIDYDNRRCSVFEAQSADILCCLNNVPLSTIIDPDNEDPTFIETFTRVTDDAHLPQHENTEVASDPYIGMELGLVRGGEGKMMHATVLWQYMKNTEFQLEMQMTILCWIIALMK